MTRSSRLRFLWPALCAILALIVVVCEVRYRKLRRTAAASKEKAKRPPPPAFDKRDSAYFRALAAMSDYQSKPPLKPDDGARLAAYDRIELNKYWAQARGGEPATFAKGALDFTQHTTVALTPAMSVSLAEPCAHYRYELSNKSDRPLPAPILFQDARWDSAAALVAQAGFQGIADETERAIAIWRFVCARRVFGDPPTEGKEEHDALKFLAIYGYGFCDDTARAVATLAGLSGLAGRVWMLDGHLVAEIQAGGKWRMFDADQQAYFHRAGAPHDVLGVEELSAGRQAFDHMVSFRNEPVYASKFTDCFLTRENNQLDENGASTHVIQPILRAGERLTMTNYNWGRYFLGKYPTPPPRFLNGSFIYPFHPRDLIAGQGKLKVEPVEGGHRLSNPGSETATASIDFAYPFPIVGGLITGAISTQGNAGVRLEDEEHGRVSHADLTHRLRFDLDRFVSVLASTPTYRYTLAFSLSPGATIELRNLVVSSDFQFAPLALVRLQPGANEIRAHFPEGSDPAAFELTIDAQ